MGQSFTWQLRLVFVLPSLELPPHEKLDENSCIFVLLVVCLVVLVVSASSPTSSVPDVGSLRPAIRVNSVLFPAPLRPTMSVNPRFGSVASTFTSTGVPAPAGAYDTPLARTLASLDARVSRRRDDEDGIRRLARREIGVDL